MLVALCHRWLLVVLGFAGFCMVCYVPVPTGYISQAGTPDVSSAEQNRAFLRKLAGKGMESAELPEFRAEITP